jgi:DNA-binding Lrp family transcriptional regulator
MPDRVIEEHLLNDYQRGFPLEPRPFARIGGDLGVSEEEVLELFGDLSTAGKIGRIGAVVRPNMVGVSTLAAMAVPLDRLEEVATRIGERREVNHCYEREHRINVWFVVTGGDRADIERVLTAIEEACGLPVLDLPIVQAYHIDLGCNLDAGK